MRVAIANSDQKEVQGLRSLLDDSFETCVITEADKIGDIIDSCDVLIIDSNYSSDQGINLLMNIESMSHLPALMIVPLDDQRCAVEAMRAGAQNFLVKTENYQNFLPIVIEESYKQFNKAEELKRTIQVLKERVNKLESGLESAGSEAPPQDNSEHSVRTRIMQQIVARLQKGDINLPSYSDINTRLHELMVKEAGIQEIARLLEQDAGVTSKLISVANSALNRGVTDATTMEQAIKRLGLVTTKNYVEVITNRSLYTSKNKKYKNLLRQLFQHSLASAHAANAIAGKLKLEATNEVFTIAMLHDVGKLFLMQILTELAVDDPSIDLLADEQVEKFLFDHHAQFGTVLLKRWKLPVEFINVVERHEVVAESDPISKVLCIVNCADLLAQKMGFGTDHYPDVDVDTTFSAKYLKLSAIVLDQVKKEVQTLMQDSPS